MAGAKIQPDRPHLKKEVELSKVKQISIIFHSTSREGLCRWGSFSLFGGGGGWFWQKKDLMLCKLRIYLEEINHPQAWQYLTVLYVAVGTKEQLHFFKLIHSTIDNDVLDDFRKID